MKDKIYGDNLQRMTSFGERFFSVDCFLLLHFFPLGWFESVHGTGKGESS